MYFTLDVIEIIHYSKSKYFHDNGVRKQFITPYNPTAFADLGTIDYLVADTNALSLDNTLKVRQIYIPGILYNLQQDNLSQRIHTRAEKQFASPSSSSSGIIPKLPKKILQLQEENGVQDGVIEEESASKDTEESKENKGIKEEEEEEEEEKQQEEDNEDHPKSAKSKDNHESGDVSLVISLKEALRLRKSIDRQDTQQSENTGLVNYTSESEIDHHPLASTYIPTRGALPTSLAQLSEAKTLICIADREEKEKKEGKAENVNIGEEDERRLSIDSVRRKSYYF